MNIAPSEPARPTLLMYGLDWHMRQSDAVAELLIKPLAPWLDVMFVAWDGMHPPPVPPADQSVCFFELEPPCLDPDWRRRPLTWIPMWDHSATRHADAAWWQGFPSLWRIVSLSKNVEELARTKAGLAVFSTRYHRDPETIGEAYWAGLRTLYYWNRMGLAGPRFLQKLCQVLEIDLLLFRPTLDPGVSRARSYELAPTLGATRVELVPFQHRKEDYVAQVNRANFLLAPRPVEGVGMVMLDALARGCGVLAADHPTASEYIRPRETGMLLTCSSEPDSSGRDDHRSWWKQGDKFLLSDNQDWDALSRMDWCKLGSSARQDASRQALAWRDALPRLARFLVEAPAVAAAEQDQSSSLSITQAPLVSVCLPNLNSLPFIGERLDSIRAQTWQAWECVVVDAGSTDGSLDLLRQLARDDTRFRIHDVPSSGACEALNSAVSRAKGEYVYIAKAGDALHRRGIEIMVEGLRAHPDCGACHTPLIVTDEAGNRLNTFGYWNPTDSLLGAWMYRAHVRRHPCDALIVAMCSNVYSSVTQMLYRRDAMMSTGSFPTEFGTMGFLAWHMHLGMATDILYLPEAVGTWRRHSGQGSTQAFTADFYRTLYRMVHWNTEALLDSRPELRTVLPRSWFGLAHRLMAFQQEVRSVPAYGLRAAAIVRALMADPGVVLYLNRGRWTNDLDIHFFFLSMAQAILSKCGIQNLIKQA